jgi:hypothetical protein
MLIELPAGMPLVWSEAMMTYRVIDNHSGHVVALRLGTEENDDLCGYQVFERSNIMVSHGVAIVLSSLPLLAEIERQRIIESWYAPTPTRKRRYFDKLRERCAADVWGVE